MTRNYGALTLKIDATLAKDLMAQSDTFHLGKYINSSDSSCTISIGKMQVVAALPQRWIYIAFIIQNAFLIDQATTRGSGPSSLKAPRFSSLNIVALRLHPRLTCL